MAVQQTIAQWLRGEGGGVNIPWFSGRENGAAWVNGWGGYVDAQISLLKEAARANWPDYGPTDALPHQAGDAGLIVSQFEVEANQRTRIKTAWGDHGRRGQPVELLTQLYWAGWGGSVIVQQNGLGYSLSAAPTAGTDPTGLLVITDLGETIADLNLFPAPQREGITTSGQTAALSPAGAASTRVITSKTIPAGNSWWMFDSRTDLCNRFAVIFPSSTPALLTYGIATFAAATFATVTWNNSRRFQDENYLTLVGAPVVTSGSPPGSIYESSSGRTTTSTTITASSAWTGTALVIAFPAGTNPFCNASDSDLNVVRTIIRRWKPGTTKCVGIYALVSGLMWGWPADQTWGDAGLKWGGQVITFSTP